MNLLHNAGDVLAGAGYAISMLWLVRVFLWRRYVQKTYWEKKPVLTISGLQSIAKQKGRALPKFSILIPAKEEAGVIGKTLEHFSRLDYPKELYEILVITDEKEVLAHNGNGENTSLTTQAIVEGKQKNLSASFKNIKHVCVPYDFDGAYGGKCSGTEMPSTKARALNYGLKHVSQDADVIGIYDADTRPDEETLLHAAHEIALNGNKIKIMQGPRIQTSNFSRIAPLCKTYSLFQSLLHEWYYPAVYMKKLPYIGGSHVFIKLDLVKKLKGFDTHAQTEDAVFAVRAYLEEGEWSYFLPCMSTEQTPPTFKGFFKQRVRWATGQFQIIRMAWRYFITSPCKKTFRIFVNTMIEGPVKTIGIQLLMFVWLLHFSLIREFRPFHVSKGAARPSPFWSFLVLTVDFLFFYGLYIRYLPYSDFGRFKKGMIQKLKGASFLIFSIPAFILGILPYLYALFLHILKREIPWIKTEKTVESGGTYERS